MEDYLSRSIMEQLKDVPKDAPKVVISVKPHGLARLLCLMGFHDAYTTEHEDNEEYEMLVFCLRCGRTLCVVSSSVND